MSSLENDNIGEPVIIDETILIPIGDTVFSGKLEMNVSEMLFFARSMFVKSMTDEEQMKWNLELINKIESKFSPSGIFDGLKEVDNMTWIIVQWMEAVNQRQQGK